MEGVAVGGTLFGTELTGAAAGAVAPPVVEGAAPAEGAVAVVEDAGDGAATEVTAGEALEAGAVDEVVCATVDAVVTAGCALSLEGIADLGASWMVSFFSEVSPSLELLPSTMPSFASCVASGFALVLSLGAGSLAFTELSLLLSGFSATLVTGLVVEEGSSDFAEPLTVAAVVKSLLLVVVAAFGFFSTSVSSL